MNCVLSLKTIRKFGKRLLCFTHVTVLSATLAFSPVAFALQIKLGTAMNLRSLNSDQLTVAGVLAAGSIVEIPDRFKVKKKDGSIDADKTFNNWLSQAGYDRSDINSKIRNPLKDYFYPVRIVSLAKGSTASRAIIGKTRFMALRVLARSRGGLVVKQNARVYQGSRSAFPLHAAKHTQSAASQAPVAAPGTPEATPAAQGKDAEQDDASATDDSPAPALEQNTNAQQSTEPVEAQSGTNEECPTCHGSDGPAADLANEIAAPLNQQAYNNEARGLQGLTRQFPQACEDFIKPDGSYGPLGQKVLSAMSQSDAFKNNWAGTKKAVEACPNFNSFGEEQRRHFWVYAFAAMEAEESQCNQSVSAAADINDYGVAAGGAQIEERAGLRQTRDKLYGGHFCAGGNPYDPDLNIRCGVRMLQDMAENSEGPYSLKQNIYGQYWSSFKFDKMKAKALISQYTDCGATPYYSWKSPPMPQGYRKHHKHGRSTSHKGHHHRSRK
jgi:hypothetical protein